MSTQFRAGQTVRLNRDISHRLAATGEYKIVQLQPENGGELTFH